MGRFIQVNSNQGSMWRARRNISLARSPLLLGGGHRGGAAGCDAKVGFGWRSRANDLRPMTAIGRIPVTGDDWTSAPSWRCRRRWWRKLYFRALSSYG